MLLYEVEESYYWLIILNDNKFAYIVLVGVAFLFTKFAYILLVGVAFLFFCLLCFVIFFVNLLAKKHVT